MLGHHRVSARALHGDSHEIAKPNVDALVRLVREFDARKLERDGERSVEFPRGGEFADEGDEIVRVAAVEVELDLAEDLNLDAEVVHAFARGGGEVDVAGEGVAGGEEGKGVDRATVGLHGRRALALAAGVRHVHRHSLAQSEETLAGGWGNCGDGGRRSSATRGEGSAGFAGAGTARRRRRRRSDSRRRRRRRPRRAPWFLPRGGPRHARMGTRDRPSRAQHPRPATGRPGSGTREPRSARRWRPTPAR